MTRRRVVPWIVTAAVGVVAYVVFSGAGGDDPSPFGRAFAPGTTAGAREPGTTAVRPVRPAVEHDLATVLVTDAGPGFQPADPARYPQGPLDAAAAARLEPNPTAERARLARRGFQRGYQRAWTTAAGDVLGAVVYQFGDHGGAEGYLSDGASIVLDQGAEEFSVELEGGRGFTQLDETTTVHTVAFTREAYFFLLFAASEAGGLPRDQVVALARTQVTRVAGPR